MRDKLGFLGTLFTSLCCLGVSVVIAPLTAIGLGFLINDLILLPLVLVFLLITLWGLYTGWKRHGVRLPFFLGIFATVVLIPSFFVSAYGRILGAHLLGPSAEELINLFTMAMAGGLHSQDVKGMIFGYPTYASDMSYMV